MPPDPVSNAVRERFLQRFDGVGVTAVRRTPYGMFEVQIDVGDLVYIDENVSWIMQGQLIDSQSGRNITRERQQELNAVVFDELPLKLVIKKVKGGRLTQNRHLRRSELRLLQTAAPYLGRDR